MIRYGPPFLDYNYYGRLTVLIQALEFREKAL